MSRSRATAPVSTRRRVTGVLLGAVVVLLALASLGPSGSAAAQDPGFVTTTGAFGTLPPTVPGLATTTTAGATARSVADDGAIDQSKVDADNRRITLIVAGLVAVAVALTLVTFRYWRATKPVAPAVTATDGDVRSPRSRRVGRRSRRAVAGADHAGADDDWEPRATGEQERVSIPGATPTARPSRSQRAAALAAASRR